MDHLIPPAIPEDRLELLAAAATDTACVVARIGAQTARQLAKAKKMEIADLVAYLRTQTQVPLPSP